MLALVCTLAFALAPAAELVDHVYTIPADEWRYVELGIGQRTALVEAEYEVRGGSDQVRLALMRRDDLEHLSEGIAHGVVEETEPGRSGRLKCAVRPPGDYVVVVDNRMGDGRRAVVRIRIHLEFPAGAGVPERISAQRRLAVILMSFAAFFAIVTWSGRKLLPPLRR
jgi:hypothetical protein